jgi:glyoxylase-like metal-dependent hydrolase (beta-lactamase superfamily II)
MTYQVTKIAHNIWAIDEDMVRCFLLEGTERALLIDSGISTTPQFAETVKSLTRKPITLVLTHSDQDHTGGQGAFPPAFLHPAEFELYAAKGNDLTRARAIWEGEVFDLGGMALEVVLLPGHTPGSIALLDRGNRRLFIGDVVSDSWVFLFGKGRSVPAYLASLEKLEGLLGGAGLSGLEEQLGQERLSDLAGQPVREKHSGLIDVIHSAHGSPSLGPEWIARTRVAAEKLLAGELEACEPPRKLPCKLYSYEGVNLLYAKPTE